MSALDNFGGMESWDEYCDRMDRAYEEMAKERTRLDCGKCIRSDRHPDEGFCTDIGDFVDGDETIAELGLECFEA